MVSGTLYTYPDNFRAFKALIAAQYSGAQVKISDKFVFGETNTTNEFLAKFPSGKVPAFESSEGLCLTESNAIAYYLANEQLRGGSCAINQALVHQWLYFADSDILPASCTWVFPCIGIMQFNKTASERAKEDVKKALQVLNDHLLHQTFLVGERVTLADISVACTLLSLYKHVLEPEFRKPYGNVNRWFTTVINQPQVKQVIGAVKLCEKMEQFDAKKFAEFQASQGGSAAGAKKAEKKEKKTEEKKPTAAAAAPKKKEKEVDEAEEDFFDTPVEKTKDPFAAMPKGTFDMDDFKRFYSNNDEEKSIPYFWDKFDKENYSIWRCDYKYCDELTMVFMSCNLIGGMYQRLEKLRKNAFASMCLFGENNNSTISGIWVWKGHDIAFELCDDWKTDYTSYEWKKLDPTAEDTKTQVNNYFKWIGEDKEGRKFNQGKIFK
jgi:elongation factor 1-gamma